MLFKVCYCIKLTENVIMTFSRIRLSNKQIRRVIVIFPYFMKSFHNDHNLNINKNFKIIKNMAGQKKKKE